jgi:anti-sigma regulatory factor (Ser/Thr protein kinase)
MTVIDQRSSFASRHPGAPGPHKQGVQSTTNFAKQPSGAAMERPQPIHPPILLQLAALPNAVSSARRHARDLLPRWGYSALLDSCELLVSELVTNAVKASGLPADAEFAERYDGLKSVRLRMFPTATSIFIEVWDSNAEPPVRKDFGLESEGGRGLFLVEMLSARWAVYFPKRGGKIVWCEVCNQ